MRREILLPRNVRTFERDPSWNALYRTGLFRRQGEVVTIGDPVDLFYDHRDQMVVPIIEADGSEKHYLILEEIGLPELVN